MNKLIAIEGVDGAGTTTQCERLARHFSLHMTREPSDRPIGKLLRQILRHELDVHEEKAVALLPPRQQVIYRLRRNEDMSLDEIARKMDLSRLTVRNHLNKALGAIRTYIQAHSHELVSLLLLLLLQTIGSL